ncbi:hypothetical protein N9O56_02885 [Rickettsiales bacterium]|nr:hypothetical protein [Rickettsiales bacterium]
MAILQKFVTKHDYQSSQFDNLSQESKQVLELLDNIEDFTISIRKKISKEIRANSKMINLDLDKIQ